MSELAPVATASPSSRTTDANLQEGFTFPSKEAAQAALARYVRDTGRNVLIARYSPTRMKVVCATPPASATEPPETPMPGADTETFSTPTKKRGRPAKTCNALCTFRAMFYRQQSGTWHLTQLVPHSCEKTAAKVRHSLLLHTLLVT